MVLGVSCPRCRSTSVRFAPLTDPVAVSLRCNACGTAWSAALDSIGPALPADPSRPRVLALDDDPDVGSLLARSLADFADVHAVTTAAHAVVVGAVVRPSLAILDVVLPRLDGFAVLKALRAMPGLAELPAILITGSDRADIPLRAAELRAPLLFKPLSVDALLETVWRLLPPGRD